MANAGAKRSGMDHGSPTILFGNVPKSIYIYILRLTLNAETSEPREGVGV